MATRTLRADEYGAEVTHMFPKMPPVNLNRTLAPKETGHARGFSSPASPRSVDYEADGAGSGASGPGPSTLASYRQTKEYLIRHGHHNREVLDAPTTFHLRNYAAAFGIDLTPLEEEVKGATAAVKSAAKAREDAESTLRAREAEAREAEAAAQSAAAAAAAEPLSPAVLRASQSARQRSASASKAVLEHRASFQELSEASRRAETALSTAQINLTRERSILFIQTLVRRRLQQRVYQKAWKSVVTLQKLFRSRVVISVFRVLVSCIIFLRKGALFLKLSQNGPPHDRFVWLADDLQTLCWCQPLKQHLRDKKSSGTLSLRECTQVCEGVQTATFQRATSSWPSGRPELASRATAPQLTSLSSYGDLANSVRSRSLKLRRTSSLRKQVSQMLDPTSSNAVLGKKSPLDELCCISLITESRTLDLIAINNRTRDDWLRALRIISAHMTTTASLHSVRAQRKMFGIDAELCAKHRFRAVDLLGDQFVALEFQVLRSSSGMGVVMDAASNQVMQLELGGPALASGLCEKDIIMVVNNQAVTVIEDGLILVRSLVTAAIDPSQEIVHLTVFRRYQEEAVPMIGRERTNSAQRI